MKAININGKKVEIWNTYYSPAGHGHKKIYVELFYMDSFKKFSAITNNMPAYDEANELDGSEKEEALYNIIASQIEEKVHEWLNTL